VIGVTQSVAPVLVTVRYRTRIVVPDARPLRLVLAWMVGGGRSPERWGN